MRVCLVPQVKVRTIFLIAVVIRGVLIPYMSIKPFSQSRTIWSLYLGFSLPFSFSQHLRSLLNSHHSSLFFFFNVYHFSSRDSSCSLPLCRYFSLQATNPLGFGDSVRMEIESNICREGGPLPDCFTTPLRQAWTTMEKVPVFL